MSKLQDIRKTIMDNKLSMCFPLDFNLIDHIAEIMRKENMKGDIVECGVWLGGMCIYMSKTFPDRTIWGFDSFIGCEDPSKATYKYDNENHGLGQYVVPYKVVEATMAAFNCKNVKLVQGYFKDTLPNSDINDIALLRVDCDTYSATREVLEHLYDKVTKGGFLIFDDYCLHTARDAVNDFYNNRKLDIKFLHPETNLPTTEHIGGVWCRKVV